MKDHLKEDKFDFLGLHLNSRFHLYKQDNQNIVRGGGGGGGGQNIFTPNKVSFVSRVFGG